MKATLSKQLHERAIAIIKIIEKAELRIKGQQEMAQIMEKNGFDYSINVKRIVAHRAAIERLEKAYIETINRINKAI